MTNKNSRYARENCPYNFQGTCVSTLSASPQQCTGQGNFPACPTHQARELIEKMQIDAEVHRLETIGRKLVRQGMQNYLC